MKFGLYKRIKHIRFMLQLWDGVWSIPLAALLFLGSGYLLQWIFTDPVSGQGGPGFYDPSFIQAGFYASLMCVFVNTVAWWGLYFNFRAVWRYYVGRRNKEDGKVLNLSKDDFLKQKPWVKIVLLIGLYVFFSVEWFSLFVLLR